LVALCLTVTLIGPAAAARPGAPLRSEVVPANGVGIHCLDSGGTKPALLFIPGLGDTAYMMEDFATRFVRTNRVVIMTRRGFGRSSVPRDGYDLSSRVEDIRGLLDALKIRRAVLIGHSIAGDELTAFAIKYPERVASLVYLDAAYDRGDPEAPQPTGAVWGKVLDAWVGNDEAARKSLERYRAAQRRTFFGVWTGAQERNLRETVVVNVDGTVSSRTPPWVARAISGADKEARPPLSSVKAPALLIFARQRLERRGLALDEATRTGLIRDEEMYEAYFSRYLSGLRKQTNFQIVVMSQTMHHLYLERPLEVERAMRRFLATHNT
jgi:pimeloyl-ACP methyl ester carboxylesterase